MAKMIPAFVQDLPQYTEIIDKIDNATKSCETTEQSTQRLIDKVNKYNIGGE